MKYRWRLLLFLGVFSTYANSFSIDVDHAEIKEVLQKIAHEMRQTIIVSPEVTGEVTLHLHGVSANEMFGLLLSSHQLIKVPMAGVFYVVPEVDYLKSKQASFKVQTFLEEASPLTLQCRQIHYAKAEDLAKLIEENSISLLTKRGHVRVDSRTNMLCIQEVALRLQDINQLMNRVDVPVEQVLIEARLASVENDAEKELGVHFSVISEKSPEGSSPTSSYSLAVLKLLNGNVLDVQLKALEDQGRGELISTPSLLTGNHESAFIESGEEIPYQEVSESGATSVAFKKAVLSLKVTPQIMPDKAVLLELQVNQDRPSSRMVLGVPAITTRQMKTHVLVKAGQTVVLGGIYESLDEENQHSIPILGRIPVLGGLFRVKSHADHKRELLIFVTPTIVSQSLDKV